MTDYLDNLNDRQRAAVTYTDGPLRVVAGAGTGKTRVLTHRVAYLIDTNEAEPEAVLALTFTNKAAAEMQARVNDLVSADTNPHTSTFHSFGATLLRRHADMLPVDTNFTIRDSQQSRKLIKQAINEANLDSDEWDAGTIAGFISKQKSAGLTADAFARSVSDEAGFEPVVADIWPRYREKLREQNSVDFADLLLLTEALLAEHDPIRRQYQNKWRHILVDEYQDTNPLQADIISHLAGNDANIFVVGDGDQTIYSWRGATTENIFSFDEQFSDAETVVLSENYRSTERILQAANDVIANNEKRHDKDLQTSNPTGEKITLHTAANEQDEAKRIARTLKSAEDPADWAVLYRTNAQSRVIEEALMDANIPYDIAGTSFFDRKAVRDLLAYLRLALNRDADADRRRIISRPRRGIGEKTLNKIISGRTDKLSSQRQNKVEQFEDLLDRIKTVIQTKPPSQAVNKVIEVSGLADFYEDDSIDRQENMQELSGMAARYDSHFSRDAEAMRKFLQNVALTSDQDQISDDGVRLMTVHAAKGLEFPAVWITGLEDELFPHKRDDQAVDEEERRLFYVALTRAQEKLVLSYAQSRQLYGSREFKAPSPFLDHIDDEILEKRDAFGSGSGTDSDDVIFFD